MTKTFLTLALLGASGLGLAACNVDVQGDGDKVNIATPVGSLSAKGGVDPASAGLAVYPGARVHKDSDDDSSSANVIIGSPFFGLKVVAVELESDDAPRPIVDFYKREMQKYGEVMECQGEIDMNGGPGSHTPECHAKTNGKFSLVVGVKDDHRIVAVEPRGNGSKIGLVHLETGK